MHPLVSHASRLLDWSESPREFPGYQLGDLHLQNISPASPSRALALRSRATMNSRSVPQRSLIAVLFLTFAIPAPAAGMEVTNWQLKTFTQDLTELGPITDSRTVTSITNPFLHNSVSQVGLNTTVVAYDYSWLTDMAFGTFNTSFTHALRTREMIDQSSGRVRFIVDEDAIFHLHVQLSYIHTPGDFFSVRAGVSLYDYASDSFFLNPPAFKGGNGYFEPSNGTYSLDLTHDLIAGNQYQFGYLLDSQNLGDNPPTGTMDVTAHINWWITPEPSTLLLIAAACSVHFRVRRRPH